MAPGVTLCGSCRCGGKSTVRDCGWELDEDVPRWPTVCMLRRNALLNPQNTASPGPRNKQSFELNGGSSTHIDAPSHFIAGGRTVGDLTPSELAGVPLVVIDITDACSRNADHELTTAEVRADEALHGEIPRGSLVCVRTGWSTRWRESKRSLASRRGSPDPDPFTPYHNATDRDDVHPYYNLPVMHFPGISPEAAKMIAEHDAGVVGIGVDTLSPDSGSSTGFGVHHAILGADKYILENMNLEGLPPRGATAVVAPVALTAAPEAPARVFAFVPEFP